MERLRKRGRTPGSTAGALDIGGDELVFGPVERGGTICARLWKHQDRIDEGKLQMAKGIEGSKSIGRTVTERARRVGDDCSDDTTLREHVVELIFVAARWIFWCGRGGSQDPASNQKVIRRSAVQ